LGLMNAESRSWSARKARPCSACVVMEELCGPGKHIGKVEGAQERQSEGEVRGSVKAARGWPALR
jgi:hypothetical protein